MEHDVYITFGLFQYQFFDFVEISRVEWRRGRVVDSGPRGPGFNPQPGRLSL